MRGRRTRPHACGRGLAQATHGDDGFDRRIALAVEITDLDERFSVKLCFYLDELDGDSGALRVIPGTNDYNGEFARQMRLELEPWTAIEERFGVRPEEIPSWPIRNQPGDMVIGNYRTVHATFGGSKRRRLFTMNYREAEPSPTG